MDLSPTRRLLAEALADIAPEAEPARLRDDEDLRTALDLDSMDFMNLVIALSARTGRAIPEADVPRLFTLRGLHDYLGTRAGAG